MNQSKESEKMFQEIRELFKVTAHCSYLNSAGQAPLPLPTFEAYVKEYQGLHEFGDIFFMEQLTAMQSLMGLFARWTGGVKENFSLVPSTSHGFNMLARGIKKGLGIAGAGSDLKPKFISLLDEFPSTTVPFESNGFEMVYMRPNEEGHYELDLLMELIEKERPIGLVMSHVQYGSGFRIDLEALKKKIKDKGLIVLVNGTQAMPYFRPNFEDGLISGYLASLHKWGMSAHIGSLLYVSPSFLKKYPVSEAGWLSIEPRGGALVETEKNIPINLKKGGDQYLLGTFNLGVIRPLATSMNLIEKYNIIDLQNRVFSLQAYLDEKILELNNSLKNKGLSLNCYGTDKKNPSFIRSFELLQNEEGRMKKVPLKMGDIDLKLKEMGVVTAIRQDRLRISMNIFNNEQDVDKLVDSLYKIWHVKNS